MINIVHSWCVCEEFFLGWFDAMFWISNSLVEDLNRCYYLLFDIDVDKFLARLFFGVARTLSIAISISQSLS